MSKSHKPERDREIFKVLRAIRGRNASEVAAKCRISAQTIRNMRSGRTRYPQHYTLSEIARAAGLRYTLIEAKDVRTLEHEHGGVRFN